MSNFEVALVKRACPICGKEVDSEIIMNQKLTKEKFLKLSIVYLKG